MYRIMIVDDEPLILAGIASLLNWEEYQLSLIHILPSLGFYGQFLPMVQDYSCAESPFWIANPFVALTYPEEHPFWSAVEEKMCIRDRMNF